MIQMRNPKITEGHLARRAVVYLRQSSSRQVRQNTESQRLQRSLSERARDLGWQEVEVLDSDLGCSASIGSNDRPGFERLVSSVALGEVGLILSREISRLSRRDRDWCHLMEVCQIFGTLIGDDDQIYDLNQMDDQLVLGIKGTLSVVELKVMNLRMVQGQEAKARRGELVRQLPGGYVRDADGKIVRDPDERVQKAIELVLSKFREMWSIRQTFKWLRDREVEIPVSKSGGGGSRVVWQLPSQSVIGNLLRNPIYAGCYVYGRRPGKTMYIDGKLSRRPGRMRDAAECRVFLRDHHEGYIDWPTFEENQRMIRRNSLNLKRDESMGSVQAGHGLLVGLLRCGRCGRKFNIRYSSARQSSGRYLCKGDFDAGGRYCVGFGSGLVDRRFGKMLLEAISPAGVDASLAAIEQLGAGESDRRQALVLQLQEQEYRAHRAFEQYDEVDPRNRLVAAELERRWSARLEDVEVTRSALSAADGEELSLSEEDRGRILELGRNFANVWNSESCSMESRKKIVRTLVREVMVDLDDSSQILSFAIHWQGGAHSKFEMKKSWNGSGRKTSVESLDIVERMAVRYGDDQIAAVLNRLGHRTGMDKRWNEHRVAAARRRHSISGRKRASSDPDLLSLGQAARHCGVSHHTIGKLVSAGLLPKDQIVSYAPWEIRREDLDSDPVRSIVEHLRETGKLVLKGGRFDIQSPLFP